MKASHNQIRSDYGFTLVEMVIVMLVMAILVGVAAPRLMDTASLAAERAFARQLQLLVESSERYRAVSGVWPSDGLTGEVPTELETVITREAWAATTPLGGEWDTETKDSGVEFAVGAVFTDVPTERLLAIDRELDDGSLSTGSYRLIDSKRYYYVVDP